MSRPTLFPYRDLTMDEARDLRFLIGEPDPKRNQVTAILGGGQETLRSSPRILRLMQATMTHTIQELGSDQETGRRLFLGGALFFSSVFQYVNRASKLPVYDEALQVCEQRDSRDLIMDGPSQLKTEAKTFYKLLEMTVPVFDAGNEPEEIAFIGASALHVLVIESLKYRPVLPEQLAAYETDSSLQELSEMFRRELG